MDRSLADTTRSLEKLGYRMTPQRMFVLRAVDESRGHVSADDIFASVRAQFPRISFSTIYRTLDLLQEIGLITKSDLGAGRVQYHRADEAHHHHLVCQRCGGIVDLDEQELEPLWEALRKRYNFKACERHMAIFGNCRQCQS
ncbi:MAG: transcriptional repressor [Chloroflexi bacterium]|nr:transcriptional repressor [Chloroflexota bacterium]